MGLGLVDRVDPVPDCVEPPPDEIAFLLQRIGLFELGSFVSAKRARVCVGSSHVLEECARTYTLHTHTTHYTHTHTHTHLLHEVCQKLLDSRVVRVFATDKNCDCEKGPDPLPDLAQLVAEE